MERSKAISLLKGLVGKDLRKMADDCGITVFKDGKKNKGWAGHVIERSLGLPLNSSRAPNFGSWELKVFPVLDRNGVLVVKETIAITMLDPVEVLNKAFAESHLYNKLKKLLIVARIWESAAEPRSLLYSVGEFDLTDPNMYSQVKSDYESIKRAIKRDEPLSGKMGILIQPRTKGAGHGSTSRAFYARTTFVHQIASLEQPDIVSWLRSDTGLWNLR